MLAVPNDALPDALADVTGLQGKIVLDANRLGGEAPPAGFPSIAEYVKATTHGSVANVFNLNEGARAAVEQLSRDTGMHAVKGGPLQRATTQEDFRHTLNAIVEDIREDLLFYRLVAPEDL